MGGVSLKQCYHTSVNVIIKHTIQLYCLCVEKFAFWLVIYIKTFSKMNNKTSIIYIKNSIKLTIKHQQLNETRS